jgi:hypothetical protein
LRDISFFLAIVFILPVIVLGFGWIDHPEAWLNHPFGWFGLSFLCFLLAEAPSYDRRSR